MSGLDALTSDSSAIRLALPAARTRTLSRSATIFAANLPALLFSRRACIIRSNGLEFVVRPRTTDVITVAEIAADRLYAPRLDRAPTTAEIVVDLGADFGAFAVWAFAVFRPARFVLVEPSDVSLQLLRVNAQHSGFAEISDIVHAAIYERSGSVGFKRHSRIPANSSIQEDSSERVRALTFRELLDTRRVEIVDFLKVDIEGAERFLLVDGNRDLFAERIRYAVLEVHGRHVPFRDAMRYFARLGFECLEWDPRQWGCRTRMLEVRNPRFEIVPAREGQ